MTLEVTKSEWVDWKNSRVTKAFLERIFNKREEIKEAIVEGQITAEERDNHIGQCQGIKDSIDYAVFNFETINDISTEEQEKGA